VAFAILGIAFGSYAAMVGALYLGQRRLLYRPDNRRPALDGLAALEFREAALTTRDGLRLLAWYRPPCSGRPAIVYFHGNGGHIGYRRERLARFAAEGYGVLTPEYRGYGGNPGRPTEAGLCEDGRAALDFLGRGGIAADRLVLYGESLGAGVAVRLAAERRVAGLVLEAPPSCVAEVAQCHYPFVPARWLVRDRFDALSAIGRVAARVLVTHGERDRVVPVRFGRALLEAASPPKEGWFAPEAGHEDLARFGALEAAVAFIERRVVRATAVA
jgi:hypothetical protein